MKKLSVLLVAIILLSVSCKDKEGTKLLPNVTGAAGEVVLVIEPDQWNSNIGQEFRNKFNHEHPALPQKEPMFDLVHIPYSAFSSIFKTHRTLVFAKVDKKMSEAKVVIQENIWAKPQLIVNVLAPDKESLEQIIKEKGDLIIARVLKAEMNRYADNYKKYEQYGLADQLEKKFGIRLTLPKGYTLDLDTTDFVWIENRGRGDMVQGIFVYSFEKTDEELTTDYIFKKRNYFTKKYVPGPKDGSWMAVEEMATPFKREFSVNDIPVIELRNLWKIENDFMGGPFVNFTLINEKNNKVICLDGFVYAPQFDKRDYLRQVEAILNSVQMPKSE